MALAEPTSMKLKELVRNVAIRDDEGGGQLSIVIVVASEVFRSFLWRSSFQCY